MVQTYLSRIISNLCQRPRHEGDFNSFRRFIRSSFFAQRHPARSLAAPQVLAGHIETILARKAEDADADTSHIEAEIDALVADLYGLDDDEKQLVGLD